MSIVEEFRILSLCPVIGKMHAQVFIGMCPPHTESPRHKDINVSFYGPRPYITYTPVGGSDFTVIRVFAKKHGFVLNLIPATSADIVKANGMTTGMLHWVIRNCSNLFNN